MEIWAPLMEKAFFAKTVFANFFRDLSPYMAAGGDKVHIPGVYTNDHTVQTQSTQGAEVTTEGETMDDDTLDVDTHKYIAFVIGDKDLQQIAAQYDVNMAYAEKNGNQLADALEDSIAALWSSLTTNTQGDTSDVLTDYDIRYAMEKLDSLNVPMDETGWFVHPFTWWMQVYGISKYYPADTACNTSSVVIQGNFGPMDRSRGLMGSLYGRPVYVSSNVVQALSTTRNIFAHRNALAFALQTKGGGKIRSQMEYQLRNLGMLTVTDIIYGVAAMREAVGAAVNCNQTAVTS